MSSSDQAEYVDKHTGRTVPWPRAPVVEQAMADAISGPEFAANPWANRIPQMAAGVREALAAQIDRTPNLIGEKGESFADGSRAAFATVAEWLRSGAVSDAE